MRKPLATRPYKVVRSAANIESDLHVAEVNAGKKCVFHKWEIFVEKVAEDQIGHVRSRSEEHCSKNVVVERRFFTPSIRIA
jgi:hypothetical protein